MAASTGLAQRGLDEAIRAIIAMRIMTAAAYHFAFAHRMVRTLIELCPLGLVALVTYIGLLVMIQHRVVRDVNLMTAGAGHVPGFMDTAFPFNALVVFVAFQTLAILVLYRRPAILAEIQNRGPDFTATDTLRMLFTRPMAGFALQARKRCAFVGAYGMLGLENREYGIFIILVMTLEALIRATPGIVTLLYSLHRGLCRLNCHPGPGLLGQ